MNHQKHELNETPSPVWHSLPTEKALGPLRVTTDGLSTEEAKRRVRRSHRWRNYVETEFNCVRSNLFCGATG
jgi:hypothetical protein